MGRPSFSISGLVVNSSFILTAVTFGFLLSITDIGLPITDSSFHVFMNRNVQEVDWTVTFFGAIWYSLFGEISVVASRIINICMMLTCGILFTWTLIRALENKCDPFSVPEKLSLSFLGSLGFLNYYNWAYLDPSYNSQSLQFFSLFAVCLMNLLERMRVGLEPYLSGLFSFLCGVFLTALVLVKITSAGIIGMLAIILVLYQLHNMPTRTITKLGWIATNAFFGILGTATVLAVLATRGFPPQLLLDQLQAGYAVISLVNIHQLSPIQQIVNYLFFVTSKSYWALPSIILTAVMMFAGPGRREQYPFWAILAGSGILLMLSIVGPLTDPNWKVNQAILNWLFLIALFIGLHALFSSQSKASSATKLAMVGITIGPFLLSYGTSARWSLHVIQHIGLWYCLLVASVASINSTARKKTVWMVSLVLGIQILVAGYTRLENSKNQYNGKLSEAVETISFGPWNEKLRATPAQAKFYSALEPFKFYVTDNQKPPPILIDMMGRPSVVVLYLGFRITGPLWISLDHPKKENVALKTVLANLSDSELQEAWIYGQPEYSHGLSFTVLTNELAKRGLNFPDDYLVAADVPIYLPGLPIDRAYLYRPKIEAKP